MSFCVYHKETTRFMRILRNGYWQDAIYDRRQDCKMAITVKIRQLNKKLERLKKQKNPLPHDLREIQAITDNIKTLREDYLIEDLAVFKATIEKTEVKHNLMSGKPFTQSVNEPACCDPSTETYWSM